MTSPFVSFALLVAVTAIATATVLMAPRPVVGFDEPKRPVVLVPGVMGSIVMAKNLQTGKEFRVWATTFAEHYVEDYATCYWNATAKKLINLNPDYELYVPRDKDYGLYACSVLNPGEPIIDHLFYYYHNMIKYLESRGFAQGHTLFGAPYDWRYSDRSDDTMQFFKDTIVNASIAGGNVKVDVVTHSMGGLVFRSFAALNPAFMAQYVNSWNALAAPFQGAPGLIFEALVSGYNFGDPLLYKTEAHNLQTSSPSMFEMVPNPDFAWDPQPYLQVCVNNTVIRSNITEYMDVAFKINAGNTINYGGKVYEWPLHADLITAGEETLKLWSTLNSLPDGCSFRVLHGQGYPAPYSTEYPTCQDSFEDVLFSKPTVISVDGDGTVAAQSAMNGGITPNATAVVNATHVGMLSNTDLLDQVYAWLMED